MFAAENKRGRDHFNVDLEVGEYANFVSSRGSMHVQATVRPGHRQLVVAYTEAVDDQASHIQYRWVWGDSRSAIHASRARFLACCDISYLEDHCTHHRR